MDCPRCHRTLYWCCCNGAGVPVVDHLQASIHKQEES